MFDAFCTVFLQYIKLEKRECFFNLSQNFRKFFNILIEKTPAYKWTSAVQTCVAQGSTIVIERRAAVTFPGCPIFI